MSDLVDNGADVSKVQVNPSVEVQSNIVVQAKVKLLSRVNYPVFVPYGDDNIVVPPHGVAEGLDRQLIGTIPDSLCLVPQIG